jgi:hypothetical protein
VAKALTPVVTQAIPQAGPPADAEESPRTRPVTGEMITLDAFDAFDTVWGTSEAPGGTPEPHAPTSPLDEASLGSGTDTHQVWAEEITAAASDVLQGELDAPPAPAAEPTYSTPASAIPAWLEDDGPITPLAPTDAVVAPDPSAPMSESPDASRAWPIAGNDANYAIDEWTAAHAIPASDDLQPAAPELTESPDAPDAPYAGLVEPSLGEAMQDASPELPPEPLAEAPEERPRFELVRESQETEAVPDITPDPRTLRDMRVAASLDRLADRIRSGEIDVSSIAPGAPDAAILASVLAALLGGSSSR